MALGSKFECDRHLPPEGIELENKVLLLSLLDKCGGLEASNYKTRTLMKLCDDHPMELGLRSSKRRQRVTYLVDRWKRGKDFGLTRRNLLADYSNLQEGTPAAKTQAIKETPVKSETPVKATPKPKPSPAVAKQENTMTKSGVKNLGSPLRLFQTSAGVKKGMFHQC